MSVETTMALIAAGLLGVWAWNRRLWRLRQLHPWLVRRPDVEGTWEGFLHSSWTAPETGEGMPPIDAFMVIRQTFWGLRASLLTKESRSRAVVAGLAFDEEGCLLWLLYRNEPALFLQHRSRIHHGCVLLRLEPAAASGPSLTGHYWTDRGTSGQLKLRRMTLVLLDDYEGAIARREALR